MGIWPAGVSVGVTGPLEWTGGACRVRLQSGGLALLTAEEARAVAAELVRRAEGVEGGAGAGKGSSLYGLQPDERSLIEAVLAYREVHPSSIRGPATKFVGSSRPPTERHLLPCRAVVKRFGGVLKPCVGQEPTDVIKASHPYVDLIDRRRLRSRRLGEASTLQRLHSCRENTRAFGIRPFGKRWFWFIIDNTESAVRVDRNPTGEASTDAKGGES